MFSFTSPAFSPLRHVCLRRQTLLVSLLCLSALSHAASASTLTVPAQYSTIQAAITAAADGDTVLISDGTYTGAGNVDLDFGGKNLTVTSVNGASSTVIDCQASSSANHRGFYLHSGETGAVISGLTVQNGYESGSTGGGGIYTSSVGVTIQNCIFKGNTAAGSGSARDGGGVCNVSLVSSAAIAVMGCVFTDNTASYGGGLYNSTQSSTITVTGCTLTGNSAANGGGIYNVNNGTGTINVISCALTGNTASGGSGGGFYNDNENSGATNLTDCTLTGNSAADGGGIFNYNVQANNPITIINCALTGNTAGDGGGLYNLNVDSPGQIILTNCTLTGNAASGSGGGLEDYISSSNSPITLTNDIVYGDTGGEITDNPQSASPTTASYCDIQDGYTGTGNINAAPVFVNSPTDLHLSPNSRCLGAGTPNGAPTTTLDGYPRPNRPSIGAYELLSPALASLTASPTSLTGGPYVYFTAALNKKATGTTTITLTSSNPAALSVPSSVTIGAGYTSVTFHGASYPVTAVTTVTITATDNGVSQTATVTVNPPALDELTITPGSITGGGTANLETILNSKATVNATIALSSSNPSVLPVPASVAINAGYSTKTITLTSTAVTTATVITITGTYNGVSASVNITVNPVSLASVTANPTTVQGGVADSSVTAALTAKATSTATVTLTSSNPAALSVPASAVIGTGYTSKTFTATSHTVTSSTVVTITATYAGVSKTATVTVTP